MTGRLKTLIAGFIGWLTRRLASEAIPAAAQPHTAAPPPVAKKKGGRPRVHFPDRAAMPQERVRASRIKKKPAGFETPPKSCFETSFRCFETPSLLKKEKKDDDEEEVARATSIKSLTERIGENAERIVREAGKWPHGDWHRTETQSRIERLIRGGVSPQVILDTVTLLAERSGSPIRSFLFFVESIERAHHEIAAQGSLPLGPTPVREGKVNGKRRPTSTIVAELKSEHASRNSS
jgi:hypothetical protein